MEKKDYVLAMYDVRGKQDFIYRSRKCKEIVGGSQLIADVFRDYLFPAAEEYSANINENEKPSRGIYTYLREDTKGAEPEPFSREAFEERMKTYIGEVVYEGGGNFLVLYRNKETCAGVNRIFTRALLKEIGTLKVLCTYKENLNFNNYRQDQKELRRLHEINEAQVSIASPANATPFTDVSPENGFPYVTTHRKVKTKKEERVTREQKAKYVKYEEYIRSLKSGSEYDKEEYLLDNLVTKKGEESLLAVIYIDGNSMGAKVIELLDSKEKTQKSYDVCVTKLRRFSAEIDDNFVQKRREAINQALEEKHQRILEKKIAMAEKSDRNADEILSREGEKKLRRTIIAAGDEMTIICNARDALDVVKAYFKDLDPAKGSSCAGVAIFHSHSPYADAYRIAEECCENAKKAMKEAEIGNVNLMDFHYCQGGIGISLESIRAQEGTEDDKLSRPWRLDAIPRAKRNMELSDGEKHPIEETDTQNEIAISPVFRAKEDLKEKNIPAFDAVHKMVQEWHLRKQKLARTNIKALRDAAQAGLADFNQETIRIDAHCADDDKIDFMLNGLLTDVEQSRRLVYDISIVYDLWFREEM